MAKRTKLGTAGANILHRRTGAEALAVATNGRTEHRAPAFQRGQGRNQSGYKVTTIRFQPEQWKWLRQQATGRAMESGTAADASEIVRELVAAAMLKDKAAK